MSLHKHIFWKRRLCKRYNLVERTVTGIIQIIRPIFNIAIKKKLYKSNLTYTEFYKDELKALLILKRFKYNPNNFLSIIYTRDKPYFLFFYSLLKILSKFT